MTTEFEYTGHEELAQAMAMPGYNAHIAGLFSEVVAEDEVVLDFGAGIGTISEIVSREARPARLLCIEIDPQNVAVLEDKGFEVIDGAEACEARSVDVVISSNVLEHVEDDVGTLQRLQACLRPGGRAAFWVPAFQVLWSAMDDRVAHCRRYTRAGLAERFERAGFEVEKCVYQDSLGFFVTLMFKAIGRGDGRVSERSLRIYDRLIFPLSRQIDSVCSRLFGKNVMIVARKRDYSAA